MEGWQEIKLSVVKHLSLHNGFGFHLRDRVEEFRQRDIRQDLETGEVTGESSSSYLQVESFDKAVQAMARQWSPEENDKKKVTFEARL